MNDIEIKDLTEESIDEWVTFCIPEEKMGDPLFIEGIKVKKRWAAGMMKKYSSIAKLAYTGSDLVGMIQYLPKPEEKIVEITCIFVPDKENHRKGVGRALLNALVNDMKKPKKYFDNNIPLVLVTWAFDVPGWYSQHEFYQRMGFKKVKENDPFLLYFPIKEGYTYIQKKERYIYQKEDEGKALIFYDSWCPFSTSHSEKTKESIREIDQDIPIKIINKFEQPEEVKRRGTTPFCIVNKKSIKSFFLDKEAFQKEVNEALGYE